MADEHLIVKPTEKDAIKIDTNYSYTVVGLSESSGIS